LQRHPTEIEQTTEEMMAYLLAEMKAMQENMGANPKEMKEDIKTNQARTEPTQEELNAMMNRHQEKLEAAVHSMRAWR
jgi:hypothetical protein